ncbi:MAG: hypothetical protein PHH07_00690 [Candidatus Cloacimonetes bacterium]|nr:hypothetical protein [Candidatus Cloacimonadota bacterium]
MEIARCNRCLLPESIEGIIFDDEGICNHCRNYERNFEDWDQISERKSKEFRELLDKAKSLKRPYDCLVPLSGGKDSTYALYLATKIYNLRTLAVTLDNGYLSNLARENVKNALVNCDADHIFYHINRANSSQLFKTFVERSGDFCNACMRGINYAIEISLKSFNIPLVIKGSGRRVQYVSQLKGISTLNTPSYFENVIKNTGVYAQFSHFAQYRNKLERQKIAGGIFDILGIPRKHLMRFVPQHIGMYDYIYLPYTKIIPLISKEMGWSDFGEAAEHLDCELHDVPLFKNTLLVPNITKSTLHNSGLLRQGIITKEEALQKEQVDVLDDPRPPELLNFLEDNGMSYDEYVAFVKNANREKFAPNIQKLARDIYHRFRKY